MKKATIWNTIFLAENEQWQSGKDFTLDNVIKKPFCPEVLYRILLKQNIFSEKSVIFNSEVWFTKEEISRVPTRSSRDWSTSPMRRG